MLSEHEEDDLREAEIEALIDGLVEAEYARAGVETFRELRHIWAMDELGLDPKERPLEVKLFEETHEDDDAFIGLLNPWFLLGDADDDPEDVVQAEYANWRDQLFEEYTDAEMDKEHEHLMATDPTYRADYEAQEARREAASTARALANPEPESDVPF